WQASPPCDRSDRCAGAPVGPENHGTAGQGRVSGRRDQAGASGRVGRFPGLYPQGPHRCRLYRSRAPPARCAGRGVPAVRHAQRAYAGDDLRHGRAGLRLRHLRVPVPARHGRTAVRRGGRTAGAGQPQPPSPHLRPAGAPPAGERRQHHVRQPHRRREHSGRDAGGRSGRGRRAHRAAGRAAREDPAAARAVRQSAAGRARQLRRPGPEQRTPPGLAVGRAADQRRHASARRAH
ncbi:hypothetical protein OY671_008840, partial [Metschnikowia pulcherrima]